MVSCRSCGRNISSGTIRCTKCSAPFHLSCSHRYQISAEGVINVCCEPNIVISGNNSSPMRTRNKRHLQDVKHTIINHTGRKIIEDGENIKLTKMVKIEKDMYIDQRSIASNDSNDCDDCCEIIHEVHHGNDNEYIDLEEYENNNPVEITCMNNQIPNKSNLKLININNEVNNKITLETVWQGISSLQSSISNISHSLEAVSTHLNTVDPRIKDLEMNLNTMKAKTTNFDNVQNDVSGLKEELERLINELEHIKASQAEKNVDFSNIFSEIRERELKSRNIIIYNVTEDNLRISEDYSTLEDINKFNDIVTARDNSRAREILDNIPNIELDDLQTKRLGRMGINTCRPLRVTLQSREEVITIMRNRGLINKQYNVRTDLTKMQQRKIKELREELEKTNIDRENPQMTIRFINGEPKIVPIRRNFMKSES